METAPFLIVLERNNIRSKNLLCIRAVSLRFFNTSDRGGNPGKNETPLTT